MKRYLFPLVFILFYCHDSYGQRMGGGGQITEFWEDVDIDRSTIILKLKDKSTANSRKSSVRTGKLLDINDLKNQAAIKKVRSVKVKNSHSKARDGSTTESILDGIYKIELHHPSEYLNVMNSLRVFENVMYVESAQIYHPLYIPNDPNAIPNGQQYYLEQIKAYEAWDIAQGDSTMTIAIVDTGIDPDHEDLINRIDHNSDDPINGLDDDGDGYVDNYIGWDFADDDNDVSTAEDDHGTLVGGISSAESDNGIGIASAAFNSRLVPLKIFTSEGNNIKNGFEAIIYAADKGCDIINLSWGGSDGNYSQYEQDVINYAVLEKDVVVIAAAGNTNEELDFLPASYNNVLSVGAVDIEDQKAGWATYSSYIDIMAPGQDIFTTEKNDQYGTGVGTSFSVPQVSGAAALVRSLFPEWNARQVMEQLRVTADPIYNIGDNDHYSEQLGHGRLNMISSLSDTLGISVRVSDFSYQNHFGRYAFSGDTINIKAGLINFLKPVSDLEVSISIISGNAYILDSLFFIGSMGTLDSITPDDLSFPLVLDDDLEHYDKIKLRFGFIGEDYSDYQYLEFKSTPAFFNIDNGTVEMTISNKGNLGYFSDNHSGGIGVLFNKDQVVNDLGFMIGKSPGQLVDNVPNDLEEHIRDHDFIADSKIKLYGNSIADLEGRSHFIESDSVVLPMEIMIEQKILAWSEDSLSSFQIIEYRVINDKATADSNLYYGMYADWDLDDKFQNRAAWDSVNNLAIQFNADSTLLAGMGLLSDTTKTYYALDLDTRNGNTQDFEGLFSDSLKFNFLSSGFIKKTAGYLGDGNDTGNIIGGKIDSLEAYGTYKTALALVFGNSYQSLIENYEDARTIYGSYLENPAISETIYSCAGDSVRIDPEGEIFAYYADPLGDSLLYEGPDFLIYPLGDTSVYVANLDKEYAGDISQIRILVELPVADFKFSPDTLIIDHNGEGFVHFADLSENSVTWNWDFDNGYKSSIQDPTIQYNKGGEYIINLYIESQAGCPDSVNNALTILERGPVPEVADYTICKEDSVVINPGNATQIRVYCDEFLEQMIFEGEIFASDSLVSDTTYYITSIDSLVESKATEVHVSISNLKVAFRYTPDTLVLEERYLLNLQDQSSGYSQQEWYIDEALYSTTPDTVFDYSGHTSITVKSVVQDTLGCVEFSETVILPTASSIPSSDLVFGCSGEPILIKPGNGQVFHFYNDQAGTERIGKGTIYQMDSVTESGSIWVVSIDSLLESEAFESVWNISDLKGDFSMNPDPLNLREGFQVTFNDESIDASAWDWTFGINGTDTTQNPTRFYYDMGEYPVNLMVTDSMGCTDSIHKILEVVDVVSIDNLFGEQLNIYPNPAGNLLYITKSASGPVLTELYLYNQNGGIVKKYMLDFGRQTELIELPFLNQGLYFLKFRSDGYNFTRKLFIGPTH